MSIQAAPQISDFSAELKVMLARFKSLLLAFKQQLLSNETLSESRSHVEQLERLINVLREANIESNLQTEKLQQELQAQQQIIDQKSRKLIELDAHISQLKLERQQKIVEKAVISHEKCQILQVLEEEVAAIKQNLVRSQREAKELEHLYYENVKEKAEVIGKSDQIQKTNDKYRQEIDYLKIECRQHIESEKSTQASFQQTIQNFERSELERLKQEQEIAKLKQEVSKILSERDDHRSVRAKYETAHQNCEKAAHEKEIKIKDLQERLSKIEEERVRFREELRAYQNALEERSAQFSEAQVHLAKKVRESALLEAKVDELQEQTVEMQKAKNEAEAQLTTFKKQFQEVIAENEQLQKKNSAFEEEKSTYEQRYAKLENQCQMANLRIKNLEVLQEKHQQLQSIVSNFGDVLGIGVIKPEAEQKLQFGSTEERLEEVPKTSSGPYQGLFDLPRKNLDKDDLFS